MFRWIRSSWTGFPISVTVSWEGPTDAENSCVDADHTEVLSFPVLLNQERVKILHEGLLNMRDLSFSSPSSLPQISPNLSSLEKGERNGVPETYHTLIPLIETLYLTYDVGGDSFKWVKIEFL